MASDIEQSCRKNMLISGKNNKLLTSLCILSNDFVVRCLVCLVIKGFRYWVDYYYDNKNKHCRKNLIILWANNKGAD